MGPEPSAIPSLLLCFSPSQRHLSSRAKVTACCSSGFHSATFKTPHTDQLLTGKATGTPLGSGEESVTLLPTRPHTGWPPSPRHHPLNCPFSAATATENPAGTSREAEGGPPKVGIRLRASGTHGSGTLRGRQRVERRGRHSGLTGSANAWALFEEDTVSGRRLPVLRTLHHSRRKPPAT